MHLLCLLQVFQANQDTNECATHAERTAVNSSKSQMPVGSRTPQVISDMGQKSSVSKVCQQSTVLVYLKVRRYQMLRQLLADK